MRIEAFISCRVTLKPTMEVETESLIVQPASFSVEVIRTLCTTCIKDIPDINIRGRLESIHVSICSLNKRYHFILMEKLFRELSYTKAVWK